MLNALRRSWDAVGVMVSLVLRLERKVTLVKYLIFRTAFWAVCLGFTADTYTDGWTFRLDSRLEASYPLLIVQEHLTDNARTRHVTRVSVWLPAGSHSGMSTASYKHSEGMVFGSISTKP